MVALPKRLNFLFDHWLSIFLTLHKTSTLFRSQMMKTTGENVTPRIFNGSCDKTNIYSLQRVSQEPHDEPIYNALVLSTFILRPDIVYYCFKKLKAAFKDFFDPSKINCVSSANCDGLYSLPFMKILFISFFFLTIFPKISVDRMNSLIGLDSYILNRCLLF